MLTLTREEELFIRILRATAKAGVPIHRVYLDRDVVDGVYQCKPENLLGYYFWPFGHQPSKPHISITPEAAAEHFLAAMNG